MATPKELVQKIAKVTGIPETTVSSHDRNLAKAGLRSVGGRGTGAAPMSSRDAVNLLMAVAGTSKVKDSARPVQNHGRMMTNEGKWILEGLPIPELLALGDDHTLADALQALIDSVISGSMEDTFSRIGGGAVDIVNDFHLPAVIEVTMTEPYAISEIEFFRIEQHEDEVEITAIESKKYGRSKHVGPGNLSFDPPLDTTIHADMTHQHTFTHKTIAAIGYLLRDAAL